MVVLLVHLRIKPGMQDQMKAITKPVVEATRKEPGCINYGLLQDTYDDSEFYFVEEWESLEDLRVHHRTPHLIKWREQSADIVTKKVVKIYDSQEISL